nr:MAG TPA: hypothetical protein [Caudoviricetes sp.]
MGFRVIRLFSVRCCKSTTIFQTTKTPTRLTRRSHLKIT